MPRLRYASALLLASIALLAGCTAQPGGYADLRGEREGRDELPELTDYAYDNVDVSTSHYIGEHDGTSLWLARGLEWSAVCLVVDTGEKDWVVGCGGGTTKLSGVTGTYQVVADGAPAPEGATKISENVYAW